MTAHTTPIVRMIHRTENLAARKPVTTETTAYKKKNALPMKPNSTAVMPRSGIASDATRPSTALSANATIWNRTSSAVMSQALRFILPKSIFVDFSGWGESRIVSGATVEAMCSRLSCGLGMGRGACWKNSRGNIGPTVWKTYLAFPCSGRRETFTVAARADWAEWGGQRM